jgi:hypothetical protein
MNQVITNPIDKWVASDKKSYRLAITAKCAECMGCSAGYFEPGFKAQVRNCTSYHCPLYAVRPYQAKDTPIGEVV